ncbi:MAG: DUF983 domain-containing protein [Gemmatimonadales bacterium]|nr:DUF983 domain-containing protein [Gemmatimonadota bacterium]MDX2056224.1 DUF983 domain-containing protein [Gemmatimonadales bacterium]
MNALRLAGRALRLRCPNCGAGGLFSRWVRMRSHCPGCNLNLERNESGYVVGAYMFNIAASELIGVALLLAVAVATWPNPPWTLLTWGGAAFMLIAPVVFYPFAKTLFLAFDLAFRPPGQE